MAASVHILPLDHSRMRQGHADGITMPEVYEPVAEHLPKVKAMELKDGEIFLTAYPKSGTHWLYRVLDMLLRGRAEFVPRTSDSTFVDVQQVHLLPTLEEPRVFVTHLPFDRLPQQIPSKRARLVHLYRNPRAVVVSFWSMMRMSMLRMGMDNFTLQMMDDLFFSDERWFNHADQVTNYKKKHPDVPIVSLSYEELSANPKLCVKKLAEFLGVTASPQLIDDIVANTTFQRQKQIEEENDPKQRDLAFYRKGDVNDWKNYFTEEMKVKYNQKLKERAAHCPFSAEYVD